jgi:hypothetical protein
MTRTVAACPHSHLTSSCTCIDSEGLVLHCCLQVRPYHASLHLGQQANPEKQGLFTLLKISGKWAKCTNDSRILGALKAFPINVY